MKEFIINAYLIVKLESGLTNIYVRGEPFSCCKFLAVSVPIYESLRVDAFESIDQIIELSGLSDTVVTDLEFEKVRGEIDSETIFWGNCSNLQAWYEHGYDTRLLVSDIAFPLLAELSNAGDLLAQKVFKKEIIRRFESIYPSTIAYFIEEDLLGYLNPEEKKHVMGSAFPAILNNFETFECYQLEVLNYILEQALREKLLVQIFPSCIGIVEKLRDDVLHPILVFAMLIRLASGNDILNKYEPKFLELGEKLGFQKEVIEELNRFKK